jgi:hypothetical protein
MRARKARLRAEFAGWYPEIPDGEWHDAQRVTEIVRRQLQSGSPTWEISQGRVLDDRHFEFEAGDHEHFTGSERRRQFKHDG